MAEQKAVICPYCGDAQPLADRCRGCSGLFEPLSRQATHNAMGPWFVRDAERPFQPGCSYDTLLRLIDRGRVTPFTIVRGPTTRQFWTIAKHVPGLSHLLGFCHQCDASVDPGDHACHSCGAAFATYLDRNYLGLPEIRPLPWESADRIGPAIRPTMPMWRQAEGDEPRTISSFVSDDELLGTGEHSGRSLPASFGGSGQTANTPSGAATLPTEQVQSARHMPAASAATRPRRGSEMALGSTQRTVTLLAIVSVVLGIAVIILGIGWYIAASTSMQGEPPQSNTSQVPEQNESDEPTLVDLLAGYERALGLIEAADDDDRLLADRSEAYEQALQLLMQVRTHAPQESWPPDLQERIDDIRTQLDRLRLQEYFP